MSQTKIIQLEGTMREAQDYAQRMVVTEFMDTKQLPNYRLMVNYATGVGKAKAAIDTAIKFHDTVSKHPLMIGCFTEKQRDSVWLNEITKWGAIHPIFSNYQAECYASWSKIKEQHFGLVILDEAQHLTELAYTFFDNNKVDGVLILTATEPKDRIKKALIHSLTGGRKLVIKADTAIKAGILNDFEVHVMRIRLDDGNERFKLFKTNNSLYNEKEAYLKYCSLFDQAIRSRNPNRIKFAAIGRQRFIGSTKSKTLAAAYIHDLFREERMRFITFCTSIDQANELSKYTFHSKVTDKFYNLFLNNKINELVTLKMVKEGENFKNLGRGLNIQVDSNSGNLVQITGRLLRLPVGEISKLYILCAMGTYDEKWVENALAQTPPDRIQYHDLAKDLYWQPGPVSINHI